MFDTRRCQRETNDGRYQLNTLLCLPIQRVLKYHLLLKELVKNTLPQHDDYLGLEKALDAMLVSASPIKLFIDTLKYGEDIPLYAGIHVHNDILKVCMKIFMGYACTQRCIV